MTKVYPGLSLQWWASGGVGAAGARGGSHRASDRAPLSTGILSPWGGISS